MISAPFHIPFVYHNLGIRELVISNNLFGAAGCSAYHFLVYRGTDLMSTGQSPDICQHSHNVSPFTSAHQLFNVSCQVYFCTFLATHCHSFCILLRTKLSIQTMHTSSKSVNRPKIAQWIWWRSQLPNESTEKTSNKKCQICATAQCRVMPH